MRNPYTKKSNKTAFDDSTKRIKKSCSSYPSDIDVIIPPESASIKETVRPSLSPDSIIYIGDTAGNCPAERAPRTRIEKMWKSTVFNESKPMIKRTPYQSSEAYKLLCNEYGIK